jgi:hypothetical protein
MTKTPFKSGTPQNTPHNQVQQWHSSGSVTSKTSAAFKLATLQGSKSLTGEQSNKLTTLPGMKKPPTEQGSKTLAIGPKSDQGKGDISAHQPLSSTSLKPSSQLKPPPNATLTPFSPSLQPSPQLPETLDEYPPLKSSEFDTQIQNVIRTAYNMTIKDTKKAQDPNFEDPRYLSAIPLQSSSSSNKESPERLYLSGLTEYEKVETVDEDETSTIKSHASRTSKVSEPSKASNSSSKASNEPMIPPCTNHARYSLWLKKYFPYVMGREEYHFVDSVIKIHTKEAKKIYSDYMPMDWKQALGEHLYRRYMNFIIELMIIFKATKSEKMISFSRYMSVKDAFFEEITDEYVMAIDMPIIRPGLPPPKMLYPKQNTRSMYANNYQPSPFAEDIPEIAFPPPYELPYGRELPGKLEDIAPIPERTESAPTYVRESPAVSSHRREKRRQEKAHASRKTYKTIPPTEISHKDDDSSTIGSVVSWKTYGGLPVARAYVPLEERSYRSSTSRSSRSSRASSFDPYEKYLKMNELEDFDPIETWKPKTRSVISSSSTSIQNRKN